MCPGPQPVFQVITGLILLIAGLAGQSVAADAAQIQQAIERGKQFRATQQKSADQGSQTSYGRIKAGLDKQNPGTQRSQPYSAGKLTRDGLITAAFTAR